MNLTKLLDFFAGLAGSEGAEAKMEVGFGFADVWLDSQVKSTETILDNTAKNTMEIALRDYLIKKHPLEQNPVD
jgi:hypothetical protein